MATLEPIKLTVDVDVKPSPRLINLGGVWVDGDAINNITEYLNRRDRCDPVMRIRLIDGRMLTFHGEWLVDAAKQAIREWIRETWGQASGGERTG